jgi:hypothetical protein
VASGQRSKCAPIAKLGIESVPASFRLYLPFIRNERLWPRYALANPRHPCGSVGPAKGLRRGLRYPTSREKRARCGAPGRWWRGKSQRRLLAASHLLLTNSEAYRGKYEDTIPNHGNENAT